MNPYDAQYLMEFSRLFSYDHENDREVVIVGCAFLEDMVLTILKNYLVDSDKERQSILDNANGALSSFVQRAKMIYLLGLMNKTVLDDLKVVAKLRNEFAHNVFVNFDDDKIKSLCSNLKWHRISMGNCQSPKDATARDLYQVGVNQLICYLSGICSLAYAKRATEMQ